MKCHSYPEQRLEERRGKQIGNRSEGSFRDLVAAVLGFLILGGCAAFEIRTKTTALSDSGFLVRVPETPKQREAYAVLPPYKLLRGVVKENAFYAYKDEKNGVVYIGGEAEYQRYMEKVRRLVAFYETTEAKMMAHDMDENLQWRWYGSWGAFEASNPGVDG